MEDLIGKLLDGYVQVEKARSEARIATTREQAYAYDYAARSANPQAETPEGGSAKGWLVVGGLLLIGVVVFAAVKK